MVSIHTPTKGVTAQWKLLPRTESFQSTHPRRVWLFVLSFSLFVSIHTPTKGVTLFQVWICRLMRVSIHTPTKGVTDVYSNVVPDTMFQSTHPRRVWRSGSSIPSAILSFQSTHPRRVWRNDDRGWVHGYSCFNPHTHEGCDCILMPRECLSQSFNPHTHEGCDRLFLAIHRTFTTFQSTHPRRVWRQSYQQGDL